MPKRKHVKKVHTAPRTDANQGVREHIERVRKEREYIAKKIAEYKVKQQMEADRARAMVEAAQSQTIDGLQKEDIDLANA